MGTESFPGVKWPGRGVDHPPPSSAEVKALWAYVACSRVNFIFAFYSWKLVYNGLNKTTKHVT